MSDDYSRKFNLRSALVHVAIWFGFSLVFIGPLAIKSDVDWLPLGIKVALANAAVFYINVMWLMPRFLFRNRHIGYAVGVTVVTAAIMCIFRLLAAVDDQPMPHFVFGWLLPIIGMFFISTVFGYFNRDRQSRRREIDLTHQNIEFEMKFLKSQINPHFLFNALNNIYALSIIKSERTPEMILKLSDMLRFTLYGSESKKVKLEREVEYIVNFIEFQKLKMDSEPNIKLDTSNCNGEMMIEPMLLIPFIENSFKHGNIENVKKGWLQVEVKTLGPMLIFQVRNSLPSIAINKDVVGGIGVENVRKRLDILYPGRYELNIDISDSAYSVFMKIDTFSN